MHTLLHVLGCDQGAWYGFWSGLGNDLGGVALLGGLAALLRRHNCHVHTCWRMGRHRVEGTEWTVCRKHHPSGSPTHQEVLDATRGPA